MPPITTVLHVDDDAHTLEGLARSWRSYKDEWRILTAQGGLRALEMLVLHHVDVVVAD